MPDHARSVSHAPKLIQNHIDSTGPNQQYAIGKPAGDLVCKALSGEKFLREHRVLGEDQAHAPMKLDRQPRHRIHIVHSAFVRNRVMKDGCRLGLLFGRCATSPETNMAAQPSSQYLHTSRAIGCSCRPRK